MNAVLGYPLFALAGAFAVNGIPHLVKGLSGERFYTPWARPRGTGMSSPIENFLWGAANLGAAALIYRPVSGAALPHGRLVMGAAFLALGCGLAMLFGRRQG